MSVVPPTVRYLIVCDDVRFDPANSRSVTLVGVVSAIQSLHQTPYPVTHPELCVYLQVTECRGSAEGRVHVTHADSDRVLFRTGTRTIPFGNDPLEIVAVTFRIRGVMFDEPGLYWVQFWYSEQMIAQQPLLLR